MMLTGFKQSLGLNKRVDALKDQTSCWFAWVAWGNVLDEKLTAHVALTWVFQVANVNFRTHWQQRNLKYDYVEATISLQPENLAKS